MDPTQTPSGPVVLNAIVGAHVHAVWDRMGSAFGATHVDILTKLRDGGMKVARLDAWWEAFEPTKGTFRTRVYNGKLDDTIAWCRDHDVQVILCVTRSPAWAVPGKTVPRLPDNPVDCFAIGAFLGRYYAEYGNVTIEFWNEPDLTSFDAGGPRPAHYVACLQQFHAGVKSLSQVPVCFAGPSQIAVVAGVTTKANFIGMAYDEMNRLGGIRPYDMMGVHVYPCGEGPDAVSSGNSPWRLDHLRYLFARMDAEGDTRPVAITEGGYSATPQHHDGRCRQPGLGAGRQRDGAARLDGAAHQAGPASAGPAGSTSGSSTTTGRRATRPRRRPATTATSTASAS